MVLNACVNSAWQRSARSTENLFSIFCLSIYVSPGICLVSSVIFLVYFLWLFETWQVSSKCFGSVDVTPSSYNCIAARYAEESGSVVRYSTSSPAPARSIKALFGPFFFLANICGHVNICKTFRLSARWSYPPPLGNFADRPYLKEQSFLHKIRDVCTL